MKIAKVSDIAGIINKIAPPSLAEEWDNPGLQVGDPAAEVSRVMVALDATPAVVASAISTGCQLLAVHHPLIFKPLKSVTTASATGRIIHAAIRGGLSIFAAHTNYDMAQQGLNDVLAVRLGIADTKPLTVTRSQELVKLVVFVPETHLERVREAVFPHCENLGAYSECSFAAPGEGTFRPLPGAQPYIGSVGNRERVGEQRLEFLLDRTRTAAAVKALVAAHPYEEPAFDLYPLLNGGRSDGLGRIGRLPGAMTLGSFASAVATALAAPGTRFVGDPAAVVEKVALCSGSGASLIRAASRNGAQVLVTGDLKYHEAREAEELGLAVVDAGHFPTEAIMAEALAATLRERLSDSGYDGCSVAVCPAETDPFRQVQF